MGVELTRAAAGGALLLEPSLALVGEGQGAEHAAHGVEDEGEVVQHRQHDLQEIADGEGHHEGVLAAQGDRGHGDDGQGQGGRDIGDGEVLGDVGLQKVGQEREQGDLDELA